MKRRFGLVGYLDTEMAKAEQTTLDQHEGTANTSRR